MATTPLSVTKFLWAFIGWWLIWCGIQVWILQSVGVSFIIACIDSGVTNFLLAICCVIVTNVLRYYLPQKERYLYILIVTIALAAVWACGSQWLLERLLKNETAYLTFVDKTWSVRFGIAFLSIACMAMTSMIWYVGEEQTSSNKRKADAEKLSKEAELFKLRQQLQPHFLFNSLNSINALIGTRPGEARTMVQQLSEFLRGTLKREEHQWIALEEELQHLQLYLDIEKVRFGNRLTTVFETDPAAVSMKIPAMILQPLVENAIKFGLYDTIGETIIRIDVQTEDNMLVIAVQNPFDPETAPANKGTGFGLAAVQRRLYLLFGRNDLFSNNAEGNIFTTTIKIPQA